MLSNSIIWNADTNCLALVFQYFWHLLAALKQESEWPWQIPFQHFENLVVKLLAVFGKLADVATDKGEIGFGGIELAESSDPLYRFRLENIATQSIDGIRWVDNDAAGLQHFYHLLDVAGIWIIWMDGEQQSNRDWFACPKIEYSTVSMPLPSFNCPQNRQRDHLQTCWPVGRETKSGNP